MKKLNLTLFPVPKKFWMMESPQIDLAQLYWDLLSKLDFDIYMYDYRFLFCKENISFSDAFLNINYLLNLINLWKDIKDWEITKFYNYFEEKISNQDIFIFPISVLEQFRVEYLLPPLIFSYILKNKYPNKKIILFWNYPNKHAKFIIEKFKFIDSIILSWDNLSLIKFIKWENNVGNIIYRKDKKIFYWEYKHKVDINDFSLPNFSGFDLNFYSRKWKLVLPYELSRWCKNSCFFCYYIHKWWIIYKKNIEKIISEINIIKNTYSTNLFHFHDAEVNFDNNFLSELCDQILEKDLSIIWSALAIPRELNIDILEKLFKWGCRQLRFWIESWSQRILDIIWKWTNYKEITQILSDCKKVWISTYATFIVDLKQENKNDLKLTLEFIQSNKDNIDDIQICSFWELWNMPLESFEKLEFSQLDRMSKKKMLFEKFQYNLWINKWDIVEFIRNF